MFKLRFVLLGVILGCAVFLVSALRPKPKYSQKEQLIMHALFGVMDAVHFKPHEVNDALSEEAFDEYLMYLDASKRFLLKSEVEELADYELNLDDQISSSSLEFFEKANQLIEDATLRAKEIYENVITSEIDVYQNEDFEMDGEKKNFPQDEQALRDEWRKMIKRQIVAKIDRQVERQEKKDEADQKPIKEIIAKAKVDTKDQMDDWFERLARIRRSDRFETYLSTFAELFDPHSAYFSPKEKQDYDIQIGGRLEGIGARLQQDDDYVRVATIVPGGPAWKGKELEVDDLIMIVTNEGKDPVDLMGMRVDDAVQFIRGKKGTLVTLTVRKPDGSVTDIVIEREEVIIDASFARSVVLDLNDQVKNIGYIKLPVFYSTFDGGNSCAADVAEEIEKLKAYDVNGIILDLRYNGGGSLPDVIEMSGLFVEQGPIVQVKSRGKKPYIHADEDESVAYDGPLIVLVNAISASASEILAAALQDYKRAVIVGGNSTFGKATVQRFFDLDRAIRGSSDMKPLGQVKLTIQKFYRVNGGSTQLKGVVPDIILPDQFSYVEVGEREYPSALKWSEIEPVDYDQDVYELPNLSELKNRSEARVARDSTFQLIKERAQLTKEMEDYSRIPIGLNEYRDEMKRRDAEAKRFGNIMKNPIEGLQVTTLPQDVAYMELDSSRIARHEDWLKQVQKDVYLKETLMVMQDMIEGQRYVKH